MIEDWIIAAKTGEQDSDTTEWPSEITEQPDVITVRMSDVLTAAIDAAANAVDRLGITDSQSKFQLFETILYFSDPLRIVAAQQSQDCPGCPECSPPPDK